MKQTGGFAFTSPQSARRSSQSKSVFVACRLADEGYLVGMKRLLRLQGFGVQTGEVANGSVRDAVRKRIRGSDYFVGIFTRDMLIGEERYAASPWVIEEKGFALGVGKKIVMLVQKGIDDVGGLHGDWQIIGFEPHTFTAAAVQAVEQLMSFGQAA